MSGKDEIVLRKIVAYIDDALTYTAGLDYDGFIADGKTMAATAFIIGQIGELSKSVSEEIQRTNPQISWVGMRGLRNRIVHDYENIDLTKLWEVITLNLIELREQLNEIFRG
ncbi:MAG: DUF86 domain-containing protein [Oscillospiraceae bacterium]|jgi:uncharacterized protein with HEPN domain|nr:DUF86 domain-containing protein [Oscillospiraceae bacterium]